MTAGSGWFWYCVILGRLRYGGLLRVTLLALPWVFLRSRPPTVMLGHLFPKNMPRASTLEARGGGVVSTFLFFRD